MIKLRTLALACAAAAPLLFFTPSADAGCDPCCNPCPPPVQQTLCAVDPCTGCSQQLCVCLPACCAGQTPCLAGCKKGCFGRKTLTYCYPCGHRVDVLVKRNGCMKVK